MIYMLNYLWAAMILIGIIYSAFTGNLDAVTNAALSSAKDAVSLSITMIGVMSFWVGMMKIAENAGIISGATRFLRPFVHFLFPDIPQDHKSLEHITTNMIANFFGLGWAATPAGLKAINSLQELNHNKHIATSEMCTFLVINISSLQLIPVNIIAYRTEYGSASPTQIVGPAIAATFFSTLAAIIFCKIMCAIDRHMH